MGPDWTYFECLFDVNPLNTSIDSETVDSIELFAQQVVVDAYPAAQQNSPWVHDGTCKIPKLLVMIVSINGHPTCLSVDSGSLGDFI